VFETPYAGTTMKQIPYGTVVVGQKEVLAGVSNLDVLINKQVFEAKF
jgi:hypothetical protein